MRTQGVNACGQEISSAYVAREPVVLEPGGPSLTRQEFAEECDINTIMAGYEKTGVISHTTPVTPQYIDLVGTPLDLQEAMFILDEAQGAFMRLPASVRREFDNDPVKFVAFAQDPKNVDKMREWGLAEPLPPPAAVQKVEIVAGEPPVPGNGSAPPAK